MTETFELTADQVAPDHRAVLHNQGVPMEHTPSPAASALCVEALRLLAELTEPVGVLAEVTHDQFETVYWGQGHNDPRTPVGEIHGRADRLALFAVTLGDRVCREIGRLFASNDPALAAMLDSAASVAADQAAQCAEDRFGGMIMNDGGGTASTGVRRYSPGYCGWHLSGQVALFETLRPQRVGITLRDSFLMEPLKSVSGVILAGAGDIHDFPANYPFCRQCTTRGCRERIQTLTEK